MFEWIKLGRVYDPLAYRDELWTKEFAQSPSAILFEDFVRVYFCSRPAPGADGQYVSHLSYFDLDRQDLRKVRNVCRAPILPLGGYGSFDEFGTNPVSAIRHEDEVRVYYAGWTRCESVPFNAAIGLAISRDGGASFTRLGAGPVLSYSPDEPFLIGSPRIRKFGSTWYLFYVAGRDWIKTDGRPEPVYKIRMATSRDGIEWTRCNKDLLESKLGLEECQACADVTFRDGIFHMFFSYRPSQGYKEPGSGYSIGYASSPDLLTWSRRDDLAGMRPSKGDGWDSQMTSYGHVFCVDGVTHMLYQGNGMGHTGIGLARLADERAWSIK